MAHRTGVAGQVPLAPLNWDAAEAQRASDDIVEDASASSDEMRFWPAHPQDDGVQDGDTSLYIGAAGVIWALDHLTRTARRGIMHSDEFAGPCSFRWRYGISPWDYGRHGRAFGDLSALLVAGFAQMLRRRIRSTHAPFGSVLPVRG